MDTPNSKGSDFVMEFGKQIVGDDFNLDDPRRREIYEDLYYYFHLGTLTKEGREKSPHRDKTTLDPERGLLFTGDIGVGKSDCMRVFNRMFKAFRFSEAKDNIERNLKKYGEEDMLERYGYDFKRDLTIDDVGEEELEIWTFKNKIMPIGMILMQRYKLWKNEGIRTHIISNHTTDSLGTRYGERVFDRFKQMSNHLHWAGTSLRGK